MATINGNHPYADAFPMASKEELAELAASIAAVGLIHPVVLTPDGLVLDGRNRLTACQQAGVEPTFEVREGDDDDYKEFVIGANTTGRRESMTVQIAAASTALVLGHDKRVNGQWKRGALGRNPDLRASSMKEPLAQAGTVLDVLGPAHLAEVRDGTSSLNAKYELARKEKERQDNVEKQRAELAQRQQREEEHAREFFAANNDAGVWLAGRTGQHKTLASAYAQYEAENEEIRLEAEQRRREEEEAARAHREGIERMGRYLDAFVVNFQTGVDMATHPDRAAILATLPTDKQNRFLAIESTYLKGQN